MRSPFSPDRADILSVGKIQAKAGSRLQKKEKMSYKKPIFIPPNREFVLNNGIFIWYMENQKINLKQLREIGDEKTTDRVRKLKGEKVF